MQAQEARIAYLVAEKAFSDAKPKFISWLSHRDAPEGIRKIYEKNYWEWQALKSEKAKAFGKMKAAEWLERNNP